MGIQKLMMNKTRACAILNVKSDVSEEELKKRYHALMMLTHPDSVESHEYPYEVHEINRAYEYLLEHHKDERRRNELKEKSRIRWNAPQNPNAYAPRDIYQYYDDFDGNRIGLVTIDNGRFMWIPDEEFPLFLKSFHACAKGIIAEDDETKNLDRSDDMSLLADVMYLIAGQFFGVDMALSLMKKGESENVYYCGTMLELSPGASRPKAGSLLYPAGVRDHRLYVRDKSGAELGYLSFKDDRLLFGIVPLFERKAVQVKATVNKSDGKSGSIDVSLYIKKSEENESLALDDVNHRIRERLNG